mmetsp:Transcript_5804/g.14753  ORF Transcript_5804/g.14753 Transcript_5804/m.14753 type:complete len:722 (-) Transcript_5804:194-2359(-)|eukprot:CAMPEP_0177643860 /NCGR_PEP_ID=MMETSP0447-20121125/8374_1 /TAXON_ID=0 /ORGANISM="Stygamoeba regulata, Strain BSH-02190019" /LENGTH=721 /DNA_ID=CAMNT_0019146171 /DNA_START=63 /DNA_END=2228 /DNA_ORIENTATION=+
MEDAEGSFVASDDSRSSPPRPHQRAPPSSLTAAVSTASASAAGVSSTQSSTASRSGSGRSSGRESVLAMPFDITCPFLSTAPDPFNAADEEEAKVGTASSENTRRRSSRRRNAEANTESESSTASVSTSRPHRNLTVMVPGSPNVRASSTASSAAVPGIADLYADDLLIPATPPSTLTSSSGSSSNGNSSVGANSNSNNNAGASSGNHIQPRHQQQHHHHNPLSALSSSAAAAAAAAAASPSANSLASPLSRSMHHAGRHSFSSLASPRRLGSSSSASVIPLSPLSRAPLSPLSQTPLSPFSRTHALLLHPSSPNSPRHHHLHSNPLGQILTGELWDAVREQGPAFETIAKDAGFVSKSGELSLPADDFAQLPTLSAWKNMDMSSPRPGTAPSSPFQSDHAESHALLSSPFHAAAAAATIARFDSSPQRGSAMSPSSRRLNKRKTSSSSSSNGLSSSSSSSSSTSSSTSSKSRRRNSSSTASSSSSSSPKSSKSSSKRTPSSSKGKSKSSRKSKDFSTPSRTPRKASTTPQSSAKKNKGLRHFSQLVRLKVEQKQRTSYNEVAEELVQECALRGNVDQKNIRRRVYDALNVLMAMGIICKERKAITWIGLPEGSRTNLDHLQMQKEEYRATLLRKKQQLQELNALQRSYHALLARNRSATHRSTPIDRRIPLPFILVHTREAAQIYVEMTPDYRDYFFDFNMPFELHEDSEVLNQVQLSQK